MAFLKKVSPEPAGQLDRDQGRPFVIGRLQECQLVLDPNGVSRKHAEIRRLGDRYVLVDLHSRNFTFLNGRKIDPDEPPPPLRANDRIKICDVEFVFFPQPPRIRPRRPTPVRRDDRHRGAGRGRRGAPHPRRLAVQLAGQRRPARGQAPGDPRNLPEPDQRAEDRHRRPQDHRRPDGTLPPVRAGLPDPRRPGDQTLVRKAFKYRPNRRSSFSADRTTTRSR